MSDHRVYAHTHIHTAHISVKKILQSAEGKKTIFVIEMQLKFVSIVGSNVRWLRTHTHLYTTTAVCYPPQTLTTPLSPFPCSGPVSMSWQIFNELHYLRVLSSGWGLPRLQQQWRKNRYFQLCPGLEKQKICWKSKRQKKAEKQKRNGQTNANSNMAAAGCGVELFKTCAMIDYAQTDV